MAAMLRTFILRGEPNAMALHQFLRSNWRALADAGKPLAVTVQEHKAKRSTPQNARYWAVLNEIAENAWFGGKQYSAEVWHEQFRRRFIGCEEMPDGSLVGISTTTLDVAAFGDYMQRVEQYAVSELGVEIN